MLNNRVLVIGLEEEYVSLLSSMKSDFLFYTIKEAKQFLKEKHLFEAMIFSSKCISPELMAILNLYKGKPVFAIGSGPQIEGVNWVEPPPDVKMIEGQLLEFIGTLRLPPSTTGELVSGTIVKNKIFPSWGLGMIVSELNDGLCSVRFPGTKLTMKKEEHVCHKSTLRAICTVKEI